jgi:hypothetical protein
MTTLLAYWLGAVAVMALVYGLVFCCGLVLDGIDRLLGRNQPPTVAELEAWVEQMAREKTGQG